MSTNSEYQQRTAFELALFGLCFVGFLLGAAGAITAMGGVAITGAAILALGLSMFFLRQWLAE